MEGLAIVLSRSSEEANGSRKTTCLAMFGSFVIWFAVAC